MTKFVPLLAIVAMSLGLVSVVHAQADTVTFDPDMVTRAVDENSGADQNVGSPVTAAYTGTGTLTYTLGGTDAASFAIDSSTGQIKTREGVTYDHEAKSSYTVTVTASDGSGGTDDATVTINVNDVDEPPLAPAKPLTIPTPGTYYSVEVRWTPPDNTGRPHITGYDVHYSGGSGHRGTCECHRQQCHADWISGGEHSL